MKPPATAIAAAFVCGIVAGLYAPIANYSSASHVVAPGFLAVACLVVAGAVLAQMACSEPTMHKALRRRQLQAPDHEEQAQQQ